MTSLEIGSRLVGPGHSCFVIAEAGVNHNGDISLAKQLIDAAADVGADAIKFQTFKAERLACPKADKAEYQIRETGAGESQVEMLRKLELSPEAHLNLLAHARSRSIEFLSTPFDEQSADFLEQLGVVLFKVSSGDLTNHPFLFHLATKGRPLILSTGMATLSEVETAIASLPQVPLALLQCVSNYPANPADSNLRAMRTMEKRFDVPVGYSDHTLGNEVSLAAVSLGACIIEKHLTLDRTLPGPDHRASASPDEFAALVRGIRIVETALGDGVKVPAPDEKPIAKLARKSLAAACDIAAGTILSTSVIAALRPGTGLPPSLRDRVVGKKARESIPAGTLLSMEMFE
jgi:N-acetylneuraminate synthase